MDDDKIIHWLVVVNNFVPELVGFKSKRFYPFEQEHILTPATEVRYAPHDYERYEPVNSLMTREQAIDFYLQNARNSVTSYRNRIRESHARLRSCAAGIAAMEGLRNAET